MLRIRPKPVVRMDAIALSCPSPAAALGITAVRRSLFYSRQFSSSKPLAVLLRRGALTSLQGPRPHVVLPSKQILASPSQNRPYGLQHLSFKGLMS